MRKINDMTDYFNFLTDWATFERGRVCAFGLSQNGDDWCGHFSVKWQFYEESKNTYVPRVFIDADGETLTAEQFLEGVEGNCSYPFYVVDTGANYTWI